MVLFYCTFVAMKHQDQRPIAHNNLLDFLELREGGGEVSLFAGKIQQGNSLQALRLFKDTGSGVVRLEACPLRGPKEGVPIWTAFVTRWAYDQDWIELERDNVVSMAVLRPHPYVFLSGYEPVRSKDGKYLLQFTSLDGTYCSLSLGKVQLIDTCTDAQMFVECWTRLCRSAP